jgi:hypothetical protein
MDAGAGLSFRELSEFLPTTPHPFGEVLKLVSALLIGIVVTGVFRRLRPPKRLSLSLARGEFNISGFQSKNLRYRLPGKTSGQISRLLKRLRVHGLLKRIGKTYKYSLSVLGKQVITLGLKLKDLCIIPELCGAAAR